MSKKLSRFPHVYILLLGIILFCVILTYIIPAGNFEREIIADGREVVMPSSFETVERTPVGLMGFLASVPLGLLDAAEIVFLIFIVGGSFRVLQDTGAVAAGLGRIAKAGNGKSPWVIPLLMVLFALGSATFGMVEEYLVFIPIMISLALVLGYDSLTGLAIVYLGGMAGFAASITNPFNLGVGQSIAGLPLFSGMELRLALFAVSVIVSIVFVMLYARKVKNNPTISPVYDIDQTRSAEMDLSEIKEFGFREKAVLIVAAAALVILIVGVLQQGWYLLEISAVFFGMAIVAAIVGKMGYNNFAHSLGQGFSNIAEGALIVGFARGILVVLENGNIIDTILHYATVGLGNLPSMVAAQAMYGAFALLSFIIPSGTGQAAVSIPIMTPIADLVGVTRQTMVFAFQFADGVSEILTPTSGWFMAGLALAKIPYPKWVKWAIPVLIMWYVIGAVFVAIAHLTNYGPF